MGKSWDDSPLFLRSFCHVISQDTPQSFKRRNVWQNSPVELFPLLHPPAYICDWVSEAPNSSCMERVVFLPVNLKASHCYQEYTSDSLKYSDFTEWKQGELYRLPSSLPGCQSWGLWWAQSIWLFITVFRSSCPLKMKLWKKKCWHKMLQKTTLLLLFHQLLFQRGDLITMGPRE